MKCPSKFLFLLFFIAAYSQLGYAKKEKLTVNVRMGENTVKGTFVVDFTDPSKAKLILPKDVYKTPLIFEGPKIVWFTENIGADLSAVMLYPGAISAYDVCQLDKQGMITERKYPNN